MPRKGKHFAEQNCSKATFRNALSSYRHLKISNFWGCACLYVRYMHQSILVSFIFCKENVLPFHFFLGWQLMLINDSESRFLMLEAEHVGLTVIDIASMLHKVLSKYENQIQSLCFKISFSRLHIWSILFLSIAIMLTTGFRK